ncbi:hypothetical protein Ancab_038009 [Ancistrocladus abbreviatus]
MCRSTEQRAAAHAARHGDKKQRHVESAANFGHILNESTASASALPFVWLRCSLRHSDGDACLTNLGNFFLFGHGKAAHCEFYFYCMHVFSHFRKPSTTCTCPKSDKTDHRPHNAPHIL